MVAIEPVLKDIRRKLDTVDVRLPSADEIVSLTVASKFSRARIPNERKEETSTLTPEVEQASMPGKGSKNLRILDPPRLPSKTEKYLPNELQDGLVDQRSYVLDRREDESLEKNHSVQDDASQPPMVQPSLSPDEQARRKNSSRGSTVDQPASRSPNAARKHQGSERKYITPHTRRPWTTAALWPYRAWWCLVIFVLRTESLRITQRWGLYVSRHFLQMLDPPEYPGIDSFDVQTATDVIMYCLHLLLICPVNGLTLILKLLFEVLYFVVCFPVLVWLVYRHRNGPLSSQSAGKTAVRKYRKVRSIT